MAIGESMRYLREEKGFSLKKVETLTGIDGGNLSRYERNLIIPNVELCMQLAKLYGVTLDELVGQGEESALRSSFIPALKNSEKASPANTLSSKEEKLLMYFRKLSPSLQDAAIETVRVLAGATSENGLRKKT